MIFVVEIDCGVINLLDSAGNIIDPAKEGTLGDVKTILTAIRDTAGIKKVVDALPVGDNVLGRVKLTDGTNVVGVVVDGALYRVQADAKVAKGASDLVHLDALDTTSGRGRLKATLYSPEGEAIAFGSVPSSAASIKNDFVKNGANESLLVNGSTTPVVFTYPADATKDISLQEVKFVMASNSVTFGNDYFGGVSGPLPNGLLLQVISGGDTGTIYNLKQNESFVNFASPGGFSWVVSSKDMMSATYLIGGALKLKAGTGDMVKLTVRDNLTAAAVYFKCFVKANLLA